MNMHTSPEINEVAAALALAQGEIQDAEKDKDNNHLKTKYASLSAVMGVIRPVFSKHGMALIQTPGFCDGRVTMGTRILHKSGQWIHGDDSVKLIKDDAQGSGSCQTYLRKYGAAAMAGISTVDASDDDGHVASNDHGNSSAGKSAVYSVTNKEFMDALDARLATLKLGGLKQNVLALLIGKPMMQGALDGAIEKARSLEG